MIYKINKKIKMKTVYNQLSILLIIKYKIICNNYIYKIFLIIVYFKKFFTILKGKILKIKNKYKTIIKIRINLLLSGNRIYQILMKNKLT